MRPERRKDFKRRKLAEIMPILRLYLRKKDPKEIARILSEGQGRTISAWWVRARIRVLIKSI